MNRDEAVALYKEIMKLCEDMRASAVNLIESKQNNLKATGYQVRIRAVLSNESAQQIRSIAEKQFSCNKRKWRSSYLQA